MLSSVSKYLKYRFDFFSNFRNSSFSLPKTKAMIYIILFIVGLFFVGLFFDESEQDVILVRRPRVSWLDKLFNFLLIVTLLLFALIFLYDRLH